jgi:hypothetical protein
VSSCTRRSDLATFGLGNALLFCHHHFSQFDHVRSRDVRLDHFQQCFDLGFMPRQQQFDVAFIKVDSVPIKLPVE